MSLLADYMMAIDIAALAALVVLSFVGFFRTGNVLMGILSLAIVAYVGARLFTLL